MENKPRKKYLGRYSVESYEKDKEVVCLKCNGKFRGRINVRVCLGCKSLETYQDAGYLYDNTAAIVGIG